MTQTSNLVGFCSLRLRALWSPPAAIQGEPLRPGQQTPSLFLWGARGRALSTPSENRKIDCIQEVSSTTFPWFAWTDTQQIVVEKLEGYTETTRACTAPLVEPPPESTIRIGPSIISDSTDGRLSEPPPCDPIPGPRFRAFHPNSMSRAVLGILPRCSRSWCRPREGAHP